MWPWAWAAVPAGHAGWARTSSSPLSGNSGADAHGVDMGDRRQSQGGGSSQEQGGLGLTPSQLRAEAGPDLGVTFILSHFLHGGTPCSGREGTPPPHSHGLSATGILPLAGVSADQNLCGCGQEGPGWARVWTKRPHPRSRSCPDLNHQLIFEGSLPVWAS